MNNFKLGRKPREFSPIVPCYSSLYSKVKTKLSPLPAAVDWTLDMPSDLGQMLNNQIGCCTTSAYYHARQVWNFNVQHNQDTDPDKDVLRLYEWAAGYNPNDPNSDQGATCQQILTYIFKHGAPIGQQMHWHHLTGFMEVDPRNLGDIRRTIYECGCAYIGFNVPSYLMPDNGEPPDYWQVEDPNAKIIGGHCVILTGFTESNFDVISWGRRYTMSPQFFQLYTDEAYGMIDSTWFTSKNLAPMGLSLLDIEQQMSAIRALA